MYLCERCAILVASKGFEISKMQQKKSRAVDLACRDFKSSLNQTFDSIKSSKAQTLEKLSTLELKLDKK